jgi:hypothetical protein
MFPGNVLFQLGNINTAVVGGARLARSLARSLAHSLIRVRTQICSFSSLHSSRQQQLCKTQQRKRYLLQYWTKDDYSEFKEDKKFQYCSRCVVRQGKRIGFTFICL